MFDDNCLYLNQRDELRSIAESTGAEPVLIYFDISAEILKKRKEENKLTKSRHDVPSSWLENDAKKFERPTENESPVIYAENDKPDKLFEKLDGMQSQD